MQSESPGKPAGRGAVPVQIPHEPLLEAWERVKRDRPTITQKELALIWGLTEGAVSQYMRGHTPLNIEAQLWFCRYLRIPITSIWPDFEFRDLCPGKLSPEAISVAVDWSKIAESEQPHFAALIRAAANRR